MAKEEYLSIFRTPEDKGGDASGKRGRGVTEGDKQAKQKNKRLQLWWNLGRYSSFVKWVFGSYAKAQLNVIYLFLKLRNGTPTLALFALPAVSALVLGLAVSGTYLLIRFVASLVLSISVLFWMVLIDLVLAPMIGACRLCDILKRHVLKQNHFVCPHCHVDIWTTKYRVPLHECSDSSCKQVHYYLRPSTHGILYHKCKNGQALPAVDWAGRSALTRSCPICPDRLPIWIDDFGIAPHHALAVLEAGPGAGASFLRSAWIGLTQGTANGTGLRVKYADNFTNTEFQNLLKSLASGSNRTWVWHLSKARKKLLLYLHESDLHEADGGTRYRVFNQVSGLVFVVPASVRNKERESQLRDVGRLIESTREVLEKRFGVSNTALPVQAAIVVGDCMGDASPQDALTSVNGGEHLLEVAAVTFASVRYFGGEAAHAGDAVKWLLNEGGKKGVVH